MITGTVWGVTLLIVGFLAALTGGQLLLGTLFADRHGRSRAALRARPVVCTVIGLLVLAAVVAAVIVVAQVKGPGEQAAALILIGSSFVWVFGLAAVSAEVGERMPSPAASPWRALLRGSVTLGLASLLPFVGWIVILPLAIAAGVGGLALSLVAAPAPRPDSAVAGT